MGQDLIGLEWRILKILDWCVIVHFNKGVMRLMLGTFMFLYMELCDVVNYNSTIMRPSNLGLKCP